MKEIKKIRGKFNSTNIVMNYDWPIQYFNYNDPKNYEDYLLSLEESIVMCNLPMMYGSRYDKDIETNYDKVINGYKNWKDFCKRSMKFFKNKTVILNEYDVLLNMIVRLFNKLMTEDINDGNYVIIFNWIAKGLRLYYVKNFSIKELKDRLIKTEYYKYEISRLIDILSQCRIWHCQLLNQVISEDMSERFYYIKSGYELKEQLLT